MINPMLEKLQIPLGSLTVDIALVFALLYGAGQYTQRLEAIDKRVDAIETAGPAPVVQRVAILEQRVLVQDRDRAEIREALHDINNKLDSLASGRGMRELQDRQDRQDAH